MESADILQGIAEVAIGLAGFAGIAAGLGYRARGSWSEPDRKRLIAVILFALAAIFACFVPYAIYHLGFESPWRIASFLCLYTPLRAFYSQYKIVRYTPSGYSRAAMKLLFGLEFILLTLLLIVIFGLSGRYEFGIYLTATLLTLAISSFLFYRLLETSFHGRLSGNEPSLERPITDRSRNNSQNKGDADEKDAKSVAYYHLD